MTIQNTETNYSEGLPVTVGDEAKHNEQMAAVVNTAIADANSTTPTLPEGFNSVEELRSAYEKLLDPEAEMASTGTPTENSEGDNASEGGDKDSEGAEEGDKEGSEESTLENYDFSDYAEEFAENGEISQESRDKIREELGVKDEAVLDAFLDGVNSQVQEVINTAYEVVGSKEGYEKLVTWAEQNLSEGEINAFNKTFDDGDFDQFMLALNGVNAKYQMVTGDSAPLLVNGSTPATSGDVFESGEQLSEAMSNPKYHSDPAYRNKVILKLKRSNI